GDGPELVYPVMLRLAGQPCLVVGGGAVAARKAAGLLLCSADVTVVAPTLCASLADEVGRGEVRWRKGRFRPEDLEGMRLAVAATDDQPVNEAVAAEARRRGLWVNVVDQPALCDFVAPAVTRRGPITVAVSTGGASPALARELRRALEGVLGPEVEQLAVLLARFRGQVRERIPDVQRREAFWRRISAGPLLAMLRAGDEDGVCRELSARLDAFLREASSCG
ncbi:MAG: bifunctional precorrin-2 dehydrogenase/sirohydrochlorin ferrochelatase, partial [Chloroflexi bacterium]|nr:bifunctional precorrin-2 dehydrogenase/sirohydrochlorin ferrochelatase [Chloroflexota bacterium]